MSVTLSHGEDSSCVRLEGAIDIAGAAEMKTVLLEALNRRRPVKVALDGVTGLDITAVQLLWAAQHEAERAGVGFDFAGPIPETVFAALNGAGLGDVLRIP
jgi:anti-anti-sigma factor